MNDFDCRLLDDYLNGDLPGEEQARFAAHLGKCPACARTVQEQARCDWLLRQAVLELQPVSSDWLARVRRGIRYSAARKRAVRAAGLAAALLLMGFGVWWLQRGDLGEEQDTGTIATIEQRPPPGGPERAARVTADVIVQAESALIVVPVKSERPNVTILWIYPAAQTVQSATPNQPRGEPPSSAERKGL